MQIAVVVDPTADTAAALAQASDADERGFGAIAFGDSFALLGAAARQTRRTLLTIMPTNAVTRHPSVVAKEIAVIDELSGGRAMLVIGRGYSSVLSVQLAPATTAELRDYVLTLRGVLGGKWKRLRDSFDGWRGGGSSTSYDSPRDRAIPVYLAAYGPRTMRLAGAIADGVVITAAANPDLMKSAIELVRSGAREAGRDPDEVAIAALVRASMRDTNGEALLDIRASLAAAVLKMQPDDVHVPERLRTRVAELKRRYVVAEHVKWDGCNGALLDKLDLTSYMADRLAVCGTLNQVRSRLGALSELGVQLLYLASTFPDAPGVMRNIAESFPEYRNTAIESEDAR